MKQTTAVTLLMLTSVISIPALAQSTLKPLDASAVSLLSGAPSPSHFPGSSAPLRPMGEFSSAPISAPVTVSTSPTGGSVLPSGTRLSVALDRYVRERGWQLRWNIDEDYILDADLPIPSGDLIEGVTWVIQTYQSQRGMRGVTPRFARPNHVVVLEKMDVRDLN